MWEGTKYQSVPSTSIQVDEATAFRDKGLSVHIGPVGKRGKRMFTVGPAAQKPLSIPRQLLLVVAFALCCGAIGAVVVRGIGAWRLDTLLHYPSATGNITSVSTSYDGHGNLLYNIQVTYTTKSNESKLGTIQVPSNHYNANWVAGGSPIRCLYKGSFITAYSAINDEYETTKSKWWIGFLVCVGQGIFFGLIFMLIYYMYCGGRYWYYPRSSSYRDDKELIISEWGPVPTGAHQFMYLLLRSFYSMESYTSIRNIKFTKPDKMYTALRVLMHVLGVVIIATGLVIGVGMPAWFLSNYSFTLYVMAGFMVIVGIDLTAIGIFTFRGGSVASHMVETYDLQIFYKISHDKISGTIRKKD